MRTLSARTARRKRRYRVPGTLKPVQAPVETYPLAQPRVPAGVYVGAPSEAVDSTATDAGGVALQETIRKVAGGYRIISHRTGKNLGTYKTRAQAQAALARMAHYRQEAAQNVGACKYVAIGGRRTCLTGGHNHTGRWPSGQMRTLYMGQAMPGRRMKRRMAAQGSGQPNPHT